MIDLSIITVNKNNARGLEKTIKSVLAQTYQDIEYIIIDGGSTDRSVEVIKSFTSIPPGRHLLSLSQSKPQPKPSPISYWVSESDAGIYNGMNKGIRQANGEYCLFLNSGDYFTGNTVLEKMFSHHFTEDIVYANLMMENSERTRLQTFPDKLSFFWFYTQFLGHASVFIKKKLFSEIGLYNESYKIVSDWEFLLLAVCKYQCSTRYIDYPVSVLVEGGISNAPQFKNSVLQERESVLQEHFRAFHDDYAMFYNLLHNSPFKKMKRMIKKIIQR